MKNIESSIKYWMWLSTRTSISLEKMQKVLEFFGDSPEKVYLATEEHLKLCGLTPKQMEQCMDKSLKSVDKILGECDRLGIRQLTWQDVSYPASLRTIKDPPLLLYIKGNLPRLEERVTVAVVGARECTPYGIRLAGQIAANLSVQNGTVVTGMAEGVDSAAVEGALKVGGSIVSIVAGGLDKIFPITSEHYYRDVPRLGAMLSEYPPGTPHRGGHFAYRNRLLSGISNGVLIVEAKATGGTMLTAKSAIEQGKDIFVIPGDVGNPMTAGPMYLMQKHEAYPVASSGDIFQFYREIFPIRKGKKDLLSEGQMNDLLDRVTHVQDHKKTRKPPEKKGSKPKGNPEAKGGELPPRVELEKSAEQIVVNVAKAENMEKVPSTLNHSSEERVILKSLEEAKLTIDELVDITQMLPRILLTNLTNLEVEGAVIAMDNGQYSALVYLPEEEKQ